MAFLAALLLAGCTSRWQYIRQSPGGWVKTRVEVRTTPPGADVTLNQSPVGKSPFVVPVRYRYEERLYQRRNYWPYPHREEKRVRDYIRNQLTFRAVLVGHATARKVIRLEGEERVKVEMKLHPLPDQSSESTNPLSRASTSSGSPTTRSKVP